MKNMYEAVKILVLFVEPMLYGMDLIREVYQRTPYSFLYLYCDRGLTGKDQIDLPENSTVCHGSALDKKYQIREKFQEFQPDFAIINGYIGAEQTAAIRYCQQHKIPYAIESDTPLHIPASKLKATAKKLYLHLLLHNQYCYGFPGGRPQQENLEYYGIPKERNFIMPMSVSGDRLLEVSKRLPDKERLKEQYGLTGKRTFLFVGRLENVKNVPLLLRAFAGLKRTHPDTALMIVGDGSEMAMLQQLAAELAIADVHFAGYIVFPELVRYYKAADVFVLPSRYEPWGLVVNEAFTMDLPAIVSSAVGCRVDLIREGENGFIFESGSLPDLVDKMTKMADAELSPFSKQARNITDIWNYVLYLERFRGAVEYVANRDKK